MKKTILVFLITLFSVNGIAWGQNNSRYYIGIGATFDMVKELDTRIIVALQSNFPGIPPNPIMISSVTLGGPAYEAGLKKGDLLLAIEGFDNITNFGNRAIDVIETIIREGKIGDPIKITIGRVNIKNNRRVIYEAYVVRRLIDQMDTFPLDHMLSSVACFSEKRERCVNIDARVSEDKMYKKFIYFYRITNNTGKDIDFQCDLIDMALYPPYVVSSIILKPGERREIEIPNQSIPRVFSGFARIRTIKDNSYEHRKWTLYGGKKNIVTTDIASYVSGFVPKGNIDSVIKMLRQ